MRWNGSFKKSLWRLPGNILIYTTDSRKQVAYSTVPPGFGSSGYFSFQGHSSIQQIPCKGLPWRRKIVCMCVFGGGEEEDGMVERTVFPSLEQHNIDHVYYFQMWQDPNPRKFLLNRPMTWQLKEKKTQQIKERLKSWHTVSFKVLFNKESRKGNCVPKDRELYFPSFSLSIFIILCFRLSDLLSHLNNKTGSFVWSVFIIILFYFCIYPHKPN